MTRIADDKLVLLLMVGGDLGEIRARIAHQLDCLKAGRPIDGDSLATAAALCGQALDTLRRYLYGEEA